MTPKWSVTIVQTVCQLCWFVLDQEGFRAERSIVCSYAQAGENGVLFCTKRGDTAATSMPKSKTEKCLFTVRNLQSAKNGRRRRFRLENWPLARRTRQLVAPCEESVLKCR